MANGDITKEIEYDKIEVVSTWNIQVRQATKIMEEQSDGSKKELTRSFHRHVLVPFSSEKVAIRGHIPILTLVVKMLLYKLLQQQHGLTL